MSTHIGSLRWTISRARDTEGYNVATLYIDGRKVGRCNGGGYDLVGTVFAEWLQNAFAKRIVLLPENRYYGLHVQEDGGFYLDGACGIESMERIAKAIGVTWREIQRGGRDSDDRIYRIDVTEEPQHQETACPAPPP